MSDLDAALEPVREILERRDAKRSNGSAAPAPPPPASANGSAERAASPDWDVYERNRAEIQEIVKRLRNGRH
jgi:hypothetical protein